MKIFRNKIGIEMSLQEFIELTEDENRIDDVIELIMSLENEDLYDSLYLDEDELCDEDDFDEDDFDEDDFLDLPGNICLLDKTPVKEDVYAKAKDNEDYLDELIELESDEVKKIRRIIERFGFLLN